MQWLHVHSCQIQVIAESIACHQVMWGVMATKIYGDLCPGSWHMGMVLRNSSAREVHIPPRTVICNVQIAEKVSDWEVLGHTGEDLPLKEQEEPSKVIWTSSTNTLEKVVTQPTPLSPLSELEVPTLQPDVLADWDPEDQQEV